MSPEIRLTPPRLARRLMAGLVMPWMLSLNTLRWRLAPPFPSPLPPLPRPVMVNSRRMNCRMKKHIFIPKLLSYDWPEQMLLIGGNKVTLSLIGLNSSRWISIGALSSGVFIGQGRESDGMSHSPWKSILSAYTTDNRKCYFFYRLFRKKETVHRMKLC